MWLDICSLYEILACRAELYDDLPAEEAVSRFTSFGGSMRLVLADRSYESSTIARKMTARDAEELLELRYASVSSKDISHKVIHIRVRQGVSIPWG